MTASVFNLDRIGGRPALDALLHLTVRAGKHALRIYAAGLEGGIQRKDDQSPVTVADQEVEAMLRQHCEEALPQVGFMGEEQGELMGGNAELRMVVDPIDGTRAFMRGIPTWSVLVGIEDNEREPVVGIAYMPARDELYVAVKGQGAYGNGKPLRVDNSRGLDEALICHGALQQFHYTDTMRLLQRLAEQSYTQRGFADFDGYRHLLLGRAEAMVDPGVKAWDICPAALLVREAGGVFTSIEGGASVYEGSALAATPRVHGPLLKLLNS